MRAAPPVDAPISAGRVEQATSALLYAAAAVAATTAAASAFALRVEWPTLVVVAAGAAGVGARLWQPPRGRLRWDGQTWLLLPQSGPAQALSGLQLQLDFGPWVLLRWRGESDGRLAWASLRAGDAGSAWHGLRLALAAHARH